MLRNATPSSADPTRGQPRALPVLRNATQIRHSRAGLWRAISLITVHVLIALHVAHWKWTKSTVSPIEPSEAMEFSKNGIVNAGLIFFVLATASTLLLGRWFCGWACHLVALQDLARWLLARVRIRPKPIRSSVLGLIPLIAFLYMFIGPPLFFPAAEIAGQTLPAGYGWSYSGNKLTTTGFWDTFPALIPAILTLIGVGFLIVYVFGAKGFCFTGCPYGALFGAADRFAPLRIRVNDDCTGSGHCTAVCTSNVRVHEEVRDFGAVVDPGCMKCLDCVQVCPNDALHVGWGAPAIASRARAAAPAARPLAKPAFARNAAKWLIVGAFCFAAFAVFHGYDLAHRYQFTRTDWVQLSMLTTLALGIALALRGRGTTARACSLAEEALLALFFLGAMFAFRGLHELVPFLFSLGLSAMTAWLATQACLLISRRQLAVHGFRLKLEGRLLPSAWKFLSLCAAVAAIAAYGSVHQSQQIRTRGLRADLMGMIAALDHASPDSAGASLQKAVDAATALVEREPQSPDHVMTLGYLLCRSDRLDDAQRLYDRSQARFASDPRLHFQYAMLLTMRNDAPGAIARLEHALTLDPDYAEARLTLAQVYAMSNRARDAIAQFDEAVRRSPGNVDVRLTVGAFYLQIGDAARAREHLEAAGKLAPQRSDVRQALDTLNALHPASPPIP